jgi:hypothetical protein
VVDYKRRRRQQSERANRIFQHPQNPELNPSLKRVMNYWGACLGGRCCSKLRPFGASPVRVILTAEKWVGRRLCIAVALVDRDLRARWESKSRDSAPVSQRRISALWRGSYCHRARRSRSTYHRNCLPPPRPHRGYNAMVRGGW